MKISEVCTRTGLTDRTVRFYIEKGLLKKDAENINGRNCRDYDEEDIQALNRISALRKAGFSIQDILDMQQGPEVVWDIIFRHSKQLEADAASYTAIAKELKSIHIGGGISWQKLADVLAEDGNGNLKPMEFNWPEEMAEPKEKSNRVNRIIWTVVLVLLCSTIAIGAAVLWKRSAEKRQYNQILTLYTGIVDVTFHEVWREDGQSFATISCNQYRAIDLNNYFAEPCTVKLSDDVDYWTIATEDVCYISVSIRLDVPYGVANAFGAVEVDAHTGWPILQAEEVLEHKELLESYCTVTKVDYGN